MKSLRPTTRKLRSGISELPRIHPECLSRRSGNGKAAVSGGFLLSGVLRSIGFSEPHIPLTVSFQNAPFSDKKSRRSCDGRLWLRVGLKVGERFDPLS